MDAKVSPDGSRLYVSTGRGGTVAVIDTATNEPIGSVEVGERPWGIALTADGRYLYAANGPSNDVSVVDTEDPWRVVADGGGRRASVGRRHRRRSLSWCPRVGQSCRKVSRVRSTSASGR